MKLGELLRLTSENLRQGGIDEALLESELLLRSFLGLNRVEMHLHDREITPDEVACFAEIVERRLGREPLAYILGEQEFWSLTFTVSPAVLIPRPETELLIEAVLARIPRKSTFTGTILDLGSGSGVIPVVLARELPQARLIGVDISPAALAVAAENARRHGVLERIVWSAGDWFDALPTGSHFSFVVTNPPYVAELSRLSLQPELAFEPPGALFSGADGLDAVRQLISQSPDFLGPGGWLIMEIGYDQGEAVEALLRAQPVLEAVEIIKDYAGLNRLALARKI
ncbi:MAG TPA: peptide chain release factor N(5)-glutamine methyltransferase [Desulfurivibrionaceae bacterium]|nr:peptide chain release factor N(5)-glutamine methyltransferase [Desulfurivibrionaceae bacterium]